MGARSFLRQKTLTIEAVDSHIRGNAPARSCGHRLGRCKWGTESCITPWMTPTDQLVIVSGSAHPSLTCAIARELGVSPLRAAISRSADGETAVELLDSVRGKAVFIVQPTAPPVNDNLIELLALSDACRLAAAAHICAVIPYFGYARCDTRNGRLTPIAASMVSRLIQTVGIEHVIAVDLHAPQLEGFFKVPVDGLSALTMMCAAVGSELPRDTVLVSTGVGQLRMATDYAERLRMPVAILDTTRENGGRRRRPTRLLGDVRDRHCLIVDNVISSDEAIADGVRALIDAGARAPIAIAATHGILSGSSLVVPHVSKVFVTDTIRQPEPPWTEPPELHVVPIAPIIAEAISRVFSFSPRIRA
jgi:ribose-phosphate pyrophosphokinase